MTQGQRFVSPAAHGYSTNIEDEIAEHYVAPLPEKRLCAWEPRPGYPACSTPLAQLNHEKLCYRHTQLARTLKTMGQFTAVVDNDNNGDLPLTLRLPKEPAEVKELRLCAVMDCHRKLLEINKSGRCTGHQYITCGMQMKDGSIPRPVEIKPIPPIEPIAVIEALAPIESLEPLEVIQPLEPVEAPPTRRRLFPRAIAPIPALTSAAPIETETKEEVTPVTQMPTTEDPGHYRECGVMDCHEVISPHNKSGRCEGHWYIKRGMVMKDGSIPKPHTPLSASMAKSAVAKASAGTTGKPKHKPALPAPIVLPEPAAIAPGGHVSMRVPIEHLDRFWEKLPLDDKTRIVERELFGGL